MLDVVLFRVDQGGDPDKVRESQRRRYADVTLVDKVIEYDSEWRKSARLNPAPLPPVPDAHANTPELALVSPLETGCSALPHRR